jgi:hypothetical protein
LRRRDQWSLPPLARTQSVGAFTLGKEYSMFGRILAACLLLAGSATVFAHEGPGPHGGPTTDALPYYFELIVKENQLRVFVYDEKTEVPIAVKEAKGRATVLVGQEKETVALEPGPSDGENNMMLGKVGMNAGTGSRIVIVIEFPGKPAAVARFAI